METYYWLASKELEEFNKKYPIMESALGEPFECKIKGNEEEKPLRSIITDVRSGIFGILLTLEPEGEINPIRPIPGHNQGFIYEPIIKSSENNSHPFIKIDKIRKQAKQAAIYNMYDIQDKPTLNQLQLIKLGEHMNNPHPFLSNDMGLQFEPCSFLPEGDCIVADGFKLKRTIQHNIDKGIERKMAVTEAIKELSHEGSLVYMTGLTSSTPEYEWELGRSPMGDIKEMEGLNCLDNFKSHKFEVSGKIEMDFDSYKETIVFLFPGFSEITYLGKYLVEEIYLWRD